MYMNCFRETDCFFFSIQNLKGMIVIQSSVKCHQLTKKSQCPDKKNVHVLFNIRTEVESPTLIIELTRGLEPTTSHLGWTSP